MPDAYEIHEGRYVQFAVSQSAANALVVLSTYGVPAGKIWTIIGAGYYPSVSETKTCAFGIYNDGRVYPVTLADSWAYIGNTNLALAALREGMELKLYPGDYLFVARDSATAGSVMNLNFRYIESDLPPYRYTDPQSQVVRRVAGHSGNLRSSSPGSVSRGGIDVGGEGPGGHRSEPK